VYDNNESNEINKLQLLGEATSQARRSNATSIHPSTPAPWSLLPDPCTLFPAPPHCAHGKSRAWPEESDWQANQAHYKTWVPGTTLQLESAQLCVGPRGSATANIGGDSDPNPSRSPDPPTETAIPTPIIQCHGSRWQFYLRQAAAF